MKVDTRKARVDSRNKILTGLGNAERRQKMKLKSRRAAQAKAVPNIDRTKSFRLGVLAITTITFVVLLIARLAVLQLDQNQRWVTLAKKQHSTSIQVLGSRGSILDTEGRPLAVSIKSFSLGVRPKDIGNRSGFVDLLAKELGEKPGTIRSKLETQSNFVWLANQIDEEIIERIKASPLAKDIALVPDFKRVYPQGSIAGALLGRVGRDNAGIAGLEYAFNDRLKAKPITFGVRRDAKGTLLTEAADDLGDMNSVVGSLLGQLPSLFPEPVFASGDKHDRGTSENYTLRNEGQNLISTIDSVVQSILEDELDQGRKTSQARRTFGVIMDGKTGAILAMGQTPIFDPNRREVASAESFRNIVLQDSFEPGSTFKPFVLASVIDNGVSNINEIVDCENGHFRSGAIRIGDAHPQALLSVKDILVRSSNIGSAKLGLRLGGERLGSSLRNFGFGRPTQQQVSGETKGILTDGTKWTQVDTANKSFGQGVSVSSLQLVSAFSAFVNAGEMVLPRVIKDSETERHRAISPVAAAQIKEALRGVVLDEHGTGKNAAIPGVEVYGKTGTAQKASPNGGYEANRVLSSFIGVADGTSIGISRKLVVFIAVDEPNVTPRWGGTLAAPIFKRSVSRTFSYLLGRS